LFYKLFDLSGNTYTTANNTLTIDTVNPLIAYGNGVQMIQILQEHL